MSSLLAMIRNYIDAGAGMQLPSEVRHLAFKLVDPLSERDHVFALRVVHPFQRFDVSRSVGPKTVQDAHLCLHMESHDRLLEPGAAVRANLKKSMSNDVARASSS